MGPLGLDPDGWVYVDDDGEIAALPDPPRPPEAYANTEFVDLDTAQQQLAEHGKTIVATVLEANDEKAAYCGPTRFALNSSVAAGKTRMVVGTIIPAVLSAGGGVLYSVPNHRLAGEVAAAISKSNPGAVVEVYRGASVVDPDDDPKQGGREQHRMCRRHEIAELAGRAGLPLRNHVCKNCVFNPAAENFAGEQCASQRQWRRIDVDVWVMPHSLLGMAPPVSTRNLVMLRVIDEDATQALVTVDADGNTVTFTELGRKLTIPESRLDGCGTQTLSEAYNAAVVSILPALRGFLKDSRLGAVEDAVIAFLRRRHDVLEMVAVPGERENVQGLADKKIGLIHAQMLLRWMSRMRNRTRPPKPDIISEEDAGIADRIANFGNSNKRTALGAAVFSKLAKGLPFGAANHLQQGKLDGEGAVHVLGLARVVDLGEGCIDLYLDATGQREMVKAILPRVFWLPSVNVEIPDSVDLVQVSDFTGTMGALSPKAPVANDDEKGARTGKQQRNNRSAFNSATAWGEFARRVGGGWVTFRQAKKVLMAGGDVDAFNAMSADDKVDPVLALSADDGSILVMHYGNVAGSNDLEHVETGGVVGRVMPPLHEIELIACALFPHECLELEGRLEEELVRLLGHDDEVTLLRHPGNLVEAVRWMLVEGAVIQALGRFRLIRKERGTFYLVTNLPLPIRVTRTVTKRALLDDPLPGPVVTRKWAIMARLYPDRWPTGNAARLWFSDSTHTHRVKALDAALDEWPVYRVRLGELRDGELVPVGHSFEVAVAETNDVEAARAALAEHGLSPLARIERLP